MITLGKKIQIVQAANASLLTVEGLVVDETQNTFVIETKSGVVRVQKQNCVFKIDTTNIAGSMLHHRPEERLKKWKK
jgi:RNase P/RNase MRP subunit p29